jgi:hypothetical protein
MERLGQIAENAIQIVSITHSTSPLYACDLSGDSLINDKSA